MADFNIRSDAVDVEQIMKQIRARIREKRGVDYTEEQIRELATVRLETFLDPKNLRSDLLEQFRKSRPAPPIIPSEPPPIDPPYVFDDQTLFASHRGALRFVRKLLRPLLKLMFNPNTLNQILHTQAQFNVDMMKRDQRRKIEMQMFDRSRAEWNVLYYEVLHNLVLETTRNGIELKNLKMRVEALASRLDFIERRVRAMEGVVQYRPEAVRPRERDRDRGRERPARHESEAPIGDTSEPVLPSAADSQPSPVPAAATAQTITGIPGEPASGRRRRRRRRGRRGAGLAPGSMPGGTEQPADAEGAEGDEELEAGDDFETTDDQIKTEPNDRAADRGERVEEASENGVPRSGSPSDPDPQ